MVKCRHSRPRPASIPEDGDMQKYVLLLMAFLFILPSASAAPAVKWPDARKAALAALSEGDCAATWKILWHWSRTGNAEARSRLAMAVLMRGLVPPGDTGDGLSRLRHGLILSVHGAGDGSARAVAFRRSLFGQGFPSRIGGAQLLTCLDRQIDAQQCIQQSVIAGFVPDFTNYAREVEAVADAADRPARCMRTERNAPPAR